jgi:hypothetical protein
MLRHETDGTARVRPAAAALSGLAGPGVVAEIEECLRIIALNSRPPTASRTGRVARRGILVSTAVAVAAAVAVLFLLGTFPTAWIGPDPNSEPPPKEATSIHELDAEQIAGLLKRGRELIAAGDVSMARLVLKRAADAGNPSAALELGATYDPFVIRELTDPTPFERVAKLIGGAPRHDSDEAVPSRWWESLGWLVFSGVDVSVSDLSIAPDIAKAAKRLERLEDRER